VLLMSGRTGSEHVTRIAATCVPGIGSCCGTGSRVGRNDSEVRLVVGADAARLEAIGGELGDRTAPTVHEVHTVLVYGQQVLRLTLVLHSYTSYTVFDEMGVDVTVRWRLNCAQIAHNSPQ